MHSLSKNQHGFGALEIVLTILIVSTIGFIGWYVFGQKTDTGQQPTKSDASIQTDGKYMLFEGTLQNINRGCDADGICSMTIDDVVVITGGGLGPTQEDNTWGTTEADVSPGEKVMVKALKDGDNYTLQRCAECYVTRATPR